jgi:hypothetical protein
MNDDELDLYTIDMQWIKSRCNDSRDMIATAFEAIKDNPRAREYLSNAIGTLDTVTDRIARLTPSEDPETAAKTYLNDLKPAKSKSFIKRFIGG